MRRNMVIQMLLIPVGNRWFGAEEECGGGGPSRWSLEIHKIKSNIISDRSFVQVQVHSASRAFVCTYEPLDPSQYTIPRLSQKNSTVVESIHDIARHAYSRDCLVSHINTLSQSFSREIKSKYLPAPPNIDNLCKGV